MLERRQGDPRDPCEIEASIVVGSDMEVPCLIENISVRGAKLRIAPDVEIADRFRLLLPLTGSLKEEKPVQVRWRQGAAVGVQFDISARCVTA